MTRKRALSTVLTVMVKKKKTMMVIIMIITITIMVTTIMMMMMMIVTVTDDTNRRGQGLCSNATRPPCQVYERETIALWLRTQRSVCPLTDKPLTLATSNRMMSCP
jgi:flagellar basal body-associated protein FliL